MGRLAVNFEVQMKRETESTSRGVHKRYAVSMSRAVDDQEIAMQRMSVQACEVSQDKSLPKCWRKRNKSKKKEKPLRE